MTDCPDAVMRDLLPEYALGVLGPEDAARVAAHLDTCDLCRAELALAGRVRAGFDAAVPRVDVAAIIAALPAPRALHPTVRGGWVLNRRQYAAAAAVVLAVGSGIVWSRTAVAPAHRVADSSYAHGASTAETSAAPTRSRTEDGISFGGGLSDLSVSDLQALLGQMDSLRTLPSTDPESMTPVIAVNEGGKAL